MPIYHNQLAQTLHQSPKNLWLVFGDEIWQRNDALFQIKQWAVQSGFNEIIRFDADDKFDWQLLLAEVNSLSLFSNQKLIEVHLTNGKVGDAGAKTLIDLPAMLNPETIIAFHGPKLESKITNSAWFKALAKQGHYLAVYPLEGKAFQRWLLQQCQVFSISIDKELESRLLDSFEGNLPALQQELEKLSILYPQSSISLEQAEPILFQQSKYSPFQLVDALLLADLTRCSQIIDQLQQEGVAIGQIIWIVHKELKQLQVMQQKLTSGTSLNELYKSYGIWEKRKPLYQAALNAALLPNINIALKRLFALDNLSKTERDFDPFLLLKDVMVSVYYGEKLKQFVLE